MRQALPSSEFGSFVNSSIYSGGNAYASRRGTINLLVAGASRAGWEAMRQRQQDHELVHPGDVMIFREAFWSALETSMAVHGTGIIDELTKSAADHIADVWRSFEVGLCTSATEIITQPQQVKLFAEVLPISGSSAA